MSIQVRFACGHSAAIALTANTAVCHCGETRVVRTQARTPHFTGACSGPYAETKAMESVSAPVTSNFRLNGDDAG